MRKLSNLHSFSFYGFSNYNFIVYAYFEQLLNNFIHRIYGSIKTLKTKN